MRISKYINVDRNVLVEYVYDDANLIGEAYEVGVNIKNSNYNFMSNSTSLTINTSANTLFPIDLISNVYGKFNTTTYPFLQVKNYAGGFPIRYDSVKIHLPMNYTFGEYLGFFIRVYAFDSAESKTYDLSNFYFDKSDVSQSGLINYTNPPLYFQETLWGKEITIDIPSLFAVSNQRTNNLVKPNTINYNLTNGIGLSTLSPVFIDFHFITSKSTVNSVTTYNLLLINTITVPQTPEYEKIGVKIEESINGDFFEIYGVYNDSTAEFAEFINRAAFVGNRYYVEYNITMYEQNIRGKSQKIVVTDDFISKIEYRPIIKYSTTTAIIDVEMRLVDAVDSSTILRRASYGMLQDQVSKYSLRLMKINLTNANKPKIYNLKTSMSPAVNNNTQLQNNLQVETIKVPYPVLIEKFNIVAKSDSVSVGNDNYYGVGKLMILLYPFDNVVKFVIASQIADGKVEYMDLTNMGEIKMTIKNQNLSVETGLFSETGEINLGIGLVVFRLISGKMGDVRKIYESGVNVFYLTSTQQNTTTVIYSGLFKIYDSQDNVTELNNTQAQETSNITSANQTPSTITPSTTSGTAVATRRVITTTATASLPTGTSSYIVITEDTTNQNNIAN
jgi:hypothetical protein